jgi:phage shock protein A
LTLRRDVAIVNSKVSARSFFLETQEETDMMDKLMTAIRGVVARAEQSAVDANGLLILEQEIREATAMQARFRGDLATLMAHEMGTRRTVQRLEADLSKRTRQARDALDRGRDALADELADRIVDLEETLDRHRSALAAQEDRVGRLRDAVLKIEARLVRLRQDLVQARDTHVVHAAHRAGSRTSMSVSRSLAAAEESLERIKALQDEEADRLDALDQIDDEVSGRDLDRRLETGGITPDRTARRTMVLERLRQSQQTGEPS